jgi:hypothetical protein
MNFLTPLAFALAILVPIIIAMYLLKLRRTEQVVSSTYLWQHMVRDVEANAPWQRLRRNLLLLLQLLFLILLIVVLARPFTWAEGSSGQAVILIFDTSASMAATDASPNRLETAKDQGRLLISNLPEEARGTIIGAGENTQVLVSSSQDKRQLYQSLETLQIQPGSSDLTSALELASAIAARQPDAEIVIYSDGNVDLPKRLGIKGKVRFMPIGESGDNQAISLISLEPGNQEHATAFIQVVNYAAESIYRRLTIHADGRLVDAQDLEIPPQGQVSVISENIPPATEVLAAVLNESDTLTLDDQAWAVQKVSGNQNIALISQGNRFLETVLNLLPDLTINSLRPEDYEATIQTNNTTDLNIFDSYIPTSTLPSGNLFFIGPLASTPYFSVSGSLETPIPQPVNEDDPLLDYFDLEGISILNAAQISLPDWARPILVDENSGSPLLFVGESQGQRLAVLAFDPHHSDLPLRIAYPILIANLVNWLLPGRIGDIPSQIQPGEAITFTPPPETVVLNVIRPDGSSTQLDIQDGRATYADTSQLGVYRVIWGEDQSLSFAVNLSNPQESDIQPVEHLPILESTPNEENTAVRQARHEWWRPLAAIALLILVIEWLVYNRATLVKLRTQITRTVKREV